MIIVQSLNGILNIKNSRSNQNALNPVKSFIGFTTTDILIIKRTMKLLSYLNFCFLTTVKRKSWTGKYVFCAKLC